MGASAATVLFDAVGELCPSEFTMPGVSGARISFARSLKPSTKAASRVISDAAAIAAIDRTAKGVSIIVQSRVAAGAWAIAASKQATSSGLATLGNRIAAGPARTSDV